MESYREARRKLRAGSGDDGSLPLLPASVCHVSVGTVVFFFPFYPRCYL